MKVKVTADTLSDGSKVFNVAVLGYDQTLVFPCVTQLDAKVFADSLVGLVNKHSVVVAKRSFNSEA